MSRGRAQILVQDSAGKGPGLGLGLSLSRRLARELGGRLELVACDGPGACLELTLPGRPGGESQARR